VDREEGGRLTKDMGLSGVRSVEKGKT